MQHEQEMCGCGEPLHYVDPKAEESVRRMVRALGAVVPVTDARGETFLVPRHYIACHGLREADIDVLAARYGWEKG